MTKDDLDLARAKDMAHAGSGAKQRFTPDELWAGLSQLLRDVYLDYARAIRLGDEARGLRVVPVEATEGMIEAASELDREAYQVSPALVPAPEDTWSAMLAASPFAPEDGT